MYLKRPFLNDVFISIILCYYNFRNTAEETPEATSKSDGGSRSKGKVSLVFVLVR